MSILPRHLSPKALPCNIVTMIFDELSKELQSKSEMLTGRDAGSQVQFGVPSGNIVLIQFDSLHAAMYASSNNFNISLLSRKTD